MSKDDYLRLEFEQWLPILIFYYTLSVLLVIWCIFLIVKLYQDNKKSYLTLLIFVVSLLHIGLLLSGFVSINLSNYLVKTLHLDMICNPISQIIMLIILHIKKPKQLY